jgi:hypothetical protein
MFYVTHGINPLPEALMRGAVTDILEGKLYCLAEPSCHLDSSGICALRYTVRVVKAGDMQSDYNTCNSCRITRFQT